MERFHSKLLKSVPIRKGDVRVFTRVSFCFPISYLFLKDAKMKNLSMKSCGKMYINIENSVKNIYNITNMLSKNGNS